MKQDEYLQFLQNKVVIAEDYGFEVLHESLNKWLKPHCKDICQWAIKGGRRAIFANFGLHKTSMQLEIANQCIKKTGKPFLIVCPLAVVGEFRKDNKKMSGENLITYITDTDTIESYEPQIFITNYERVRMGDINPAKFGGISLDEASILRNLQTETTDFVITHFKIVPYRFLATATPAPNDYIEILNYAVYLGVASRGHLLTRFFQRDSTKAGHLTLYPNKKKEFWMWVNTWAVFINKPSDLGYSDEGYILPKLNIFEHCVESDTAESYIDRSGKLVMFRDDKNDFSEKAKDRKESIKNRCDKAYEIAKQCKSAIVWHELESERDYLESLFKKDDFNSIFGSQSFPVKEKLLVGFSEGDYSYLLTKKKIAGSGCNFQEFCHDEIFCSVDDKFNDFIQAVHRCLRFGQANEVNLHLIFTKEQYKTIQTLYRKWKQHEELQAEMTALVKEYGLNKDIIKQQMERQLFKNGKKIIIGNATVYNNDTVIIHADKEEMPDNLIHMILTSIPFGDHYEYSDNYNDMGHNHGNDKFFEQMDFLTPNLLRVLKPGRVAAIHVKDRIRYSYQNGTKFTTIDDFSGDTVRHFVKHGFYLMGKITVTTDVVRENNQTYRLGWTEQCKDATKMGVGMPEYVLLFRKAPTQMNNAYADEPVTKLKGAALCPNIDCNKNSDFKNWQPKQINESKVKYGCPHCNHFYEKNEISIIDEYDISTWQLDAHAYYRSNGDRFLNSDELAKLDFDKICKAWKAHNLKSIYSYNEHLQTCQELEELGKLSKLFTTLPVHSNTDMVWTDVNRMNTLNAKQVSGKKEKHICPLQIDIIRRLINRYTMPGEIVDDCFGGLFSTPYVAMEMGRGSIAVELNSEYFSDGVGYLHAMNHKLNIPTLFDTLNEAI